MQVMITDQAPLQIRNVVFEALRTDGFRHEVIDAFLELIVWSQADHDRTEVVAMLETLAVASSRYERGEPSLLAYQDSCVSLCFPRRSRAGGA